MDGSLCPLAATSKKEKTWKEEQGQYENWIKPIIGDTPVREVSTFTLERIKRQLVKKKRSIRTQHAVLATCRQALNLALRQGVIESNPVRQMRLPRSDNRRQRFLSRDEAEQLLDATREHSAQLHDICLLSLHTGLRAGEIFNLRWEDIDLKSETILVRDPKSGRNRYAYLTTATKSMLKERQSTAICDFVFHQANGSPLREISRTFERVMLELGWNAGQTDARLKVVFHSLRHTFASWLVQQGTPLYSVAKLMGHQSISMTERYAHLAPGGLRSDIKMFERNLTKSVERRNGGGFESSGHQRS